ncbi:nucleotidyltransferase family protein [Shewanella psychrotolerans]|uniref:nucleotidyltransferase family protein n=1 Tax=Shewanella psychrotolerans TaxID=2864206 RepID=UPI001C65A61B|nr:nucleotidyltransferase family protein [Shewanella psychrotolerans]QYK02872.1 nucleotidyltransferase family protein [Shewanella psychrotolerans]
MNKPKVNIIALLAAGESRRFGDAKLAQRLDGASFYAGDKFDAALQFDSCNEPTLIGAVYARLRVVAERVGAHLVVVVGGHLEKVSSCLPANAEFIINPDWQQGISSSIGAAAKFAQTEQASSLMIALGDQLALTVDDYLNLYLARKQIDTRVCAYYGHTLAVPAIFHRDDFDHLLSLSGDRGAKPLLKQRYQEGKLIAAFMPRGAVDIDTPEELKHFLDGDEI